MGVMDNYLRKRAEKELRVLDACVEKNEDKYSESESEYNKLKYDYALLLEQIKSADERGDIRLRDKRIDEAKRIKEQESFADSKCKIYSAAYAILAKFMNLAQFLYETDNYFMVTRSIPHRKLPRLINDTSKLMKLVGIITEFYNHLKNSAMIAFEGQEMLLKAVRDIDASNETQLEMIKKQYGNDRINDAILKEALGMAEKEEKATNKADKIIDYNC